MQIIQRKLNLEIVIYYTIKPPIKWISILESKKGAIVKWIKFYLNFILVNTLHLQHLVADILHQLAIKEVNKHLSFWEAQSRKEKLIRRTESILERPGLFDFQVANIFLTPGSRFSFCLKEAVKMPGSFYIKNIVVSTISCNCRTLAQLASKNGRFQCNGLPGNSTLS